MIIFMRRRDDTGHNNTTENRLYFHPKLGFQSFTLKSNKIAYFQSKLWHTSKGCDIKVHSPLLSTSRLYSRDSVWVPWIKRILTVGSLIFLDPSFLLPRSSLASAACTFLESYRVLRQLIRLPSYLGSWKTQRRFRQDLIVNGKWIILLAKRSYPGLTDYPCQWIISTSIASSSRKNLFVAVSSCDCCQLSPLS